MSLQVGVWEGAPTADGAAARSIRQVTQRMWGIGGRFFWLRVFFLRLPDFYGFRAAGFQGFWGIVGIARVGWKRLIVRGWASRTLDRVKN